MTFKKDHLPFTAIKDPMIEIFNLFPLLKAIVPNHGKIKGWAFSFGGGNYVFKANNEPIEQDVKYAQS